VDIALGRKRLGDDPVKAKAITGAVATDDGGRVDDRGEQERDRRGWRMSRERERPA
jgi:hypothetical protein